MTKRVCVSRDSTWSTGADGSLGAIDSFKRFLVRTVGWTSAQHRDDGS